VIISQFNLVLQTQAAAKTISPQLLPVKAKANQVPRRTWLAFNRLSNFNQS